MREIDINVFLYGHQYQSKDILLSGQSKYKKVRKMKPNPYFSNWSDLCLVFLLIMAITKNSKDFLLFCFIFSEYFTWLFNCSLWVRYLFLRTHYYFWHCGALVVKSHQVFHSPQLRILLVLKQSKWIYLNLNMKTV